ncbi:MAG: HpsJ family protein [Hormoscilla sp.]
MLGLLYLLLLPLGVGNSLRIHNSRNLQISAQLSQQLEQLAQAKSRIEQANSTAEIANIATSFNLQSPVPQIENPQEFKDSLISQVAEVERNVRTQAVAARENQKNALLKDSLKFNFGAILAGIAFIGIWVQTPWARKKYLMERRDD